MNEETEVYVKWLRSIADQMEQQGIEPGSVVTLSQSGMTETTKPEDEVINHRATKDRFFAIAWRYDS